MDYDYVVSIVTQVLLIAAIISLVVSVLTEFLIKKLFTLETKALNYFVTIFSMILTLIVAFAYFQIKSVTTTWYVWVAVVFVGFLVACISMNGYDKIFSYVYEWIKGIFSKSESEV